MPRQSSHARGLGGAQGTAPGRRLIIRSQFSKSAMNQHMPPEPVPFIDIGAQRRRLGKAIDNATKRVLDHCQFISVPEVAQLEEMLSAYCGAKHAITCANGTDALVMVLMAI